jgi:hypothetical protein
MVSPSTTTLIPSAQSGPCPSKTRAFLKSSMGTTSRAG